MYQEHIKSLGDKFFALVFLIVLSPVLIIVGILIYLNLGHPVFFRQERPGLNGKVFKIIKFRTMNSLLDKKGELLPDEARLHGIGKIVRAFSLDELPQLFNVLRGEMSFIGPRPLLVEYLPLYNKEQQKRHDVKPGITGWAQVNGRNTISWEEKFNYDIWYVDHLSFKLDMKIIWMTLSKVIKRRDINSHTHVTMEKFRGAK